MLEVSQRSFARACIRGSEGDEFVNPVAPITKDNFLIKVS